MPVAPAVGHHELLAGAAGAERGIAQPHARDRADALAARRCRSPSRGRVRRRQQAAAAGGQQRVVELPASRSDRRDTIERVAFADGAEIQLDAVS